MPESRTHSSVSPKTRSTRPISVLLRIFHKTQHSNHCSGNKSTVTKATFSGFPTLPWWHPEPLQSRGILHRGDIAQTAPADKPDESGGAPLCRSASLATRERYEWRAAERRIPSPAPRAPLTRSLTSVSSDSGFSTTKATTLSPVSSNPERRLQPLRKRRHARSSRPLPPPDPLCARPR